MIVMFYSIFFLTILRFYSDLRGFDFFFPPAN